MVNGRNTFILYDEIRAAHTTYYDILHVYSNQINTHRMHIL